MSMLIRKIFSIIITKLKSTSVRYGKLFFYKLNLTQNKNTSSIYRIVRVNKIDDLMEIIKERENFFTEMYKNWFSKGFICFVAKEEKSTIGILWLANKKEVPLEFGYKQKLNDRTEACIIDGYILKEKRGKGVYKIIWDEVIYEAQKMGIKNLYAQILNKNVRSFKVHYKLGMKDVYQILYYFRILWFNLYFIKRFRNFKDISLFKKVE